MHIRIGVVGDYNPAFHTHPIIAEAFEHAAARLGADVAAQWVPTESVTPQNAAELLAGYDVCGSRLAARIEAWRARSRPPASPASATGPSPALEAGSNILC
jgi:Asp-tRNA(Asn)/Glu-tRNA(Gln) amidotransferase A subunit family amidase